MPTPAPLTEHFLKFPPFPAPPEGVKIIPFEDWKEIGIQLFSPPDAADDVEVDGLGIPTVAIAKSHDTDSPKTDAGKRRKRRGLKKVLPPKPTKPLDSSKWKDWWEIWEETEHTKVAGPYALTMSAENRIHHAFNDFKTTHAWPSGTTGADFVWDKWRVYIGLRGKAKNNGPLDKKAQKVSELEELVSLPPPGTEEIDDEGAPHIGQVTTQEALATDADEAMEDEEEEVSEGEEADDRTLVFLANIEKSTTVFLGSHIRKHGLIWSDKYLDGIPRLLRFFFQFVKRNNLLPEHKAGIDAALTVIERAVLDLPMTSKMSKTYPDDFSRASVLHWGTKVDEYKTLTLVDDLDALSTSVDESGQPELKAQIEEVVEVSTEGENKPDAAEPAPEPKVEVWGSNGGGSTSTPDKWSDLWNQAPVEDETEQEDQTSWFKESATGEVPDDLVTDEIVEIPFEPWSDTGAADWDQANAPTLAKIIGPTALPYTHTTGVVETSLRKLTSITMPRPSSSRARRSSRSRSSSPTRAPDAVGVEEELEGKLARVVFSPWIDWDPNPENNTYATPKILESSRGLATATPPAERESDIGPDVHDAYRDDIVVLVLPKVAEMMQQSIGMGYGGTWVQLVRSNGDANDPHPSTGPEKKYWYNDGLMLVIPSFFQ